MKKGCLLLVLIALVSIHGKAQSIFEPEVVINTSGVGDGATRDLAELETQLEELLVNYSPEIYLTEVPKNPIRLFVLLNVNSGDGVEFIADMEMVMYRPIFGEERESIVFITSQRELRFRFQKEFNRGGLGRSLPEDPLQARIYYYATLGLLYYYDSFSIYGGTPFLDYLEKEQGHFEQVMSNSYQSLSQTNTRDDRYLSELKSEWGEKFRELWYIYHRTGLDAEDDSKYGQSLYSVLMGLKALREANRSLSFFQFFSDTKQGEIRHYFLESKATTHDDAKRLVDELYPNLLSRL
ncbi:DUF4835 family protein [Porphyromonadaceae bacterium W3.11]|nr:DUF4835 family protein [Porphyromonadaceae bacterium W3.11]